MNRVVVVVSLVAVLSPVACTGVTAPAPSTPAMTGPAAAVFSESGAYADASLASVESRVRPAGTTGERRVLRGRVVDSDGQPVAAASVFFADPTYSTDVDHPWVFELDTSPLSTIHPASRTYRTIYWQQTVVGELEDWGHTTTNERGDFELSTTQPLSDDRIVITAVRTFKDEAWIGGVHPRSTEAAALANLTIRLERHARVELTVRDHETPVSGARVTIWWPNEFHYSSAGSVTLSTDRAGRVSYWLPSGPALVLVHGSEGRSSTFEDLDVKGDKLEMSIQETPALAVHGTLVDEKGSPIGSGRIRAFENGRTAPPSWAEDDVFLENGPVAAWSEPKAGEFTLEGLSPERHYRIVFDCLPDNLHVPDLDVVPTSDKLSVRATRSGPIRVKLTFRPERDPRPDDKTYGLDHYIARLERRDEGTGLWVRGDLKRRDYSYELTWYGPKPGTWRVVALSGMKDEVVSAPFEILNGSGETVVPLEIAPGRKLEGVVVDEHGDTVKDAIVYCDQNGRAEGEDEYWGYPRKLKQGASTSTDNEGKFKLPDVPADATTLLVWRPKPFAETTVKIPADTNGAGRITLASSPR